MKPANTKKNFSKLEAGTARRLIQKQKMKPANTKQTFSKLEAGTARHCPPLDKSGRNWYNDTGS